MCDLKIYNRISRQTSKANTELENSMKKLTEIISMASALIKETGWDGLILVLLLFLYLKPQKIFNFKLMQETKCVLVNHYSKPHNHAYFIFL